MKLEPGLYLVATPIGTARDITLRTLDILASADVIAAEDTRSMRRLLEIHGVALADRPVISYHDHNGDRVRPRLLAMMAEGKSVAYGAEAGTPMVADPGFDLARAARGDGHVVVSAPGPSAVITALTLSGLPTDRFTFNGFLPNSSGKRKSALKELSEVPGTLIFYESPKRIAAMIRDAAEVLGETRQVAICRELTKKFEEILTGTLAELAETLSSRSLKGEIVVVVGQGQEVGVNCLDIDSVLKETLKHASVRDAADIVAARTGVKRRQVYQRALAISQDAERNDAESGAGGSEREQDDGDM